MAIAWSKTQLGKAAGDVVIRDPVVVTTTLPRFLRTGDAATLQIDIDNVDGPAGDYALNVTSDGPAKIGDGVKTISLKAKERQYVSLPLSAAAAGHSVVTVSLSGPNNLAI